MSRVLREKFEQKRASSCTDGKIQEETGELSEQILRLFKFQRSDKGEFKKSDLEGEIADVLNVVLTVALHLDIDIEEIWVRKI